LTVDKKTIIGNSQYTSTLIVLIYLQYTIALPQLANIH